MPRRHRLEMARQGQHVRLFHQSCRRGQIGVYSCDDEHHVLRRRHSLHGYHGWCEVLHGVPGRQTAARYFLECNGNGKAAFVSCHRGCLVSSSLSSLPAPLSPPCLPPSSLSERKEWCVRLTDCLSGTMIRGRAGRSCASHLTGESRAKVREIGCARCALKVFIKTETDAKDVHRACLNMVLTCAGLLAQPGWRSTAPMESADATRQTRMSHQRSSGRHAPPTSCTVPRCMATALSRV